MANPMRMTVRTAKFRIEDIDSCLSKLDSIDYTLTALDRSIIADYLRYYQKMLRNGVDAAELPAMFDPMDPREYQSKYQYHDSFEEIEAEEED